MNVSGGGKEHGILKNGKEHQADHKRMPKQTDTDAKRRKKSQRSECTFIRKCG